MVKRKTNEKEQNPVTICDQSIEVVAICDHLEKSNKDLSQSEIENLILTIRGQQVLIDRDLAGIYKVETKRLNEQVRRNIERFPDRYRFQLTKEEMMELVANCDRFKTLKFSPTTPFAFTVYGVSMLPSVLTNKKAVDTSIRIIDAFVAMRKFIIQNANILSRIAHLEKHQMETDEKIDAILDSLNGRSLLNNAFWNCIFGVCSVMVFLSLVVVFFMPLQIYDNLKLSLRFLQGLHIQTH